MWGSLNLRNDRMITSPFHLRTKLENTHSQSDRYALTQFLMCYP